MLLLLLMQDAYSSFGARTNHMTSQMAALPPSRGRL